MRQILFSILAITVLFVPAVMAQERVDPAILTTPMEPTIPEATVVGAWNITYTLGPTTAVRQVRFIAYSDRTGRFILGTPTTPTANAGFRAVWDDPPGGMFTFSGEVRIPLGNVGIETGTLVFKSLAGNANLLNCQVVYVQNVPFVASTANYVIKTGTCVATPISPTP